MPTRVSENVRNLFAAGFQSGTVTYRQTSFSGPNHIESRIPRNGDDPSENSGRDVHLISPIYPQLVGSAQVSFAIQCHQLLLHRSAPWCSPPLSLVEGFTRLSG